jgi:alkylated DNA repair dioxygenase AlkB
MLQASLFAVGDPGVDQTTTAERIHLDERSWVDLYRCAVRGTNDALEKLCAQPGWMSGTRQMYDRMVTDPREMKWFRAGATDPHPLLIEVRRWLESVYTTQLSTEVQFGGVALNHYRSGNDSVTWHRDRELRHPDQSLVAILTMGAQRPFRIRRFGGGPSIDCSPASGDVVVMGGACQMEWEHAVPKVGRAIGPRLSASWRWAPDNSHLRFNEDGYFTSRAWRPTAS